MLSKCISFSEILKCVELLVVCKNWLARCQKFRSLNDFEGTSGSIWKVGAREVFLLLRDIFRL